MIPALIHVVFAACLGWTLLSFRRSQLPTADHLPAALLLGIYADTLCTGSLVLVGIPLAAAASIMMVVAVLVLVAAASRHRLSGCLRSRLAESWRRPHWYEVLLLVSVAEKTAFAIWQLVRTPLYFDDAVTHWAGRARTLYGGVNWSLDPSSPAWLGYDPFARHYPLLTVVWRAETALICGGWDDLIGRADSLIFFLTVVATVWLAVFHFCQTRWLAALAAFVVVAVPLQAWHAAAGYSDIAVEAYAVASLAALLRRQWALAGVLAAGTAWAKNDGLIIFTPPLLLGALLLARAWRPMLWFVAGWASIAPWLLIKAWLGLGVAPNREGLSWHRETLGLLVDKVLLGPTSSILWIGILLALLLSTRTLWRDATGRALLTMFAMMLAMVVGVYGASDAHIWLVNEGTIHRTMLQLSATAVVVAAYGIWRGVISPPS